MVDCHKKIYTCAMTLLFNALFLRCLFIADDYIFDEAHDDPYQQNTSYW